MVLLTLRSLTSRLQNCETIHFCHLELLSVGYFVDSPGQPIHMLKTLLHCAVLILVTQTCRFMAHYMPTSASSPHLMLWAPYNFEHLLNLLYAMLSHLHKCVAFLAQPEPSTLGLLKVYSSFQICLK